MKTAAVLTGEKRVDTPTGIELKVVVGAHRLQRAKVNVAVGFISAEQLHTRYSVPYRDTLTKTGYQRLTQPARVNRLATDLSRVFADLPTAILVNLREFGSKSRVVEREGATYLVIDPGDSLYIVDGQHRVLAVDKLLLEDPERWRELEIPIVAMLGANERVEMDEFHIVNSTAKSVSTDLALDLLKQRAESDAGLMDRLDETGKSWMVKAQGLVERLNQLGTWHDRIQLAAQPKAGTTISSSGMANSLKPLLDMAYFGTTITEDNQLKVLDAFWKGIQRVLPDVFEEPGNYSIQKSLGVQVMHQVLVAVIEYLRTSGLPVTDPASYEECLRGPLQELQGENREGEPVSGAMFWRVGAEGAASAFTSNAGRRVLVARVRNSLPKVETVL
jgi:DGQHR domain-containing protein